MVMNFLHRSCIILSFFWTALSFSQSPSVYFNRLTMENGLSHNCVNKAIEDKNGFIWFATSEGLNRYDGKNFKSFTFSDSGPGGCVLRGICCGAVSCHITAVIQLVDRN